MVVSIILVNNPGFVNTPATQYGIFVAMTLFAPLTMICIGNRANRILEYIIMALSCAGGLSIAITLLATQTPKASAVCTHLYVRPELSDSHSSSVVLPMRPAGTLSSSPGSLGSCNRNTLSSVSTSSITSLRKFQMPKRMDLGLLML